MGTHENEFQKGMEQKAARYFLDNNFVPSKDWWGRLRVIRE